MELQESETRFSTAFLTSPVSQSILSQTTGLVLEVNERCCALYEYTQAELIGIDPEQLHLWANPTDQLTILDELQRTGHVLPTEVAIRRKSGEIRTVLFAVEPLNWKGIPSLMTSSVDITERKQAENALRESEKRFSTLFRSNPIPVGITSGPDYRILDVNDAWSQLTGYGREEALGHTATELGIATPETLQQIRAQLTNPSALRQFEIPLYTRAGQERRLLISAEPLTLGGENYYINSLLDITERRQAELALQKNEQLLRLFVEHSPAAIAMFDRQMGYILHSQRYVTDYRLGQQTLVGRSHYEIFPEMSATQRDIHRRCLAGEVVKCDEDPLPRPDGSLDWVRYELRPWYETNGEIGGLIFFSEVITARKQAEAAVRQANERYYDLFEHALEAIHQTTPDGKYLVANPAAAQLLGYASPEELIANVPDLNQHFYVDPGRRAEFQNLLEKTGEVVGFESEVYRKDGSQIWVSENVRAVRDEQGNLLYYAGSSQDITARRQAEEKLRESETRLRQVLESTPDAVFALDREYRLLINNQRHQRALADSGGHLIQVGESVLLPEYPAETLEHWRNAYDRALSGEEFSLETSWTDRAGQLHISENSFSPLRAANGELIGALLVSHDITERKLAGEKLRESEKRFAIFFEQTPLTTGVTRLSDGLFTDINPAFTSLMGYTREEALGHSARELNLWWNPADRQAVLEKLNRGEPVDNIESALRTKTGEKLEVLISGELIEINAEPSLLLQITDITRRKQIEAEVLERQKALEKVIRVGKTVAAQTTLETCLEEIYQNARFELGFDRVGLFLYDATLNQALGVLGTSRTGEILPAGFFEDVASNQVGWEQALQTPAGLYFFENYQATLNPPEDDPMYGVGQNVIVAAWGRGKPVGLISADNLLSGKRITSIDLEALQLFAGYAGLAIEHTSLLAELEMKVEERTIELSDLYDHAPNGYHSLDKHGNYALVNQTELDWLGYQRAELLGRNFGELLMPESRQRFQENFPRLKDLGQIRDVEIELIRKDGSLLPALLNAVVLYDTQGEFLQTRTVIVDLTERKKVERALRDSEEQNRLLFEESPDASALLDAEGTFLKMNHAYEELVGRSRETLLGHSSAEFEIVSPETRAYVLNTVLESRSRNEPYTSVEYALQRADGQIREVEARIFMLMLANQPRILYTVRDVTQRKQAETALRESRASLQYFFDTASDLIQSLDENGAFRYVNSAWCETLGYSVEEALHLSIYEVVAASYQTHCRNLLDKLAKDQQPQQLEVVFITRGGEAVIVEGSVTSWKDHSGHIVTNGIFRNVTERKKSQETLRKSRDQLSAANIALEKAARMKDEFLASMSHELRTPLTGILGLAEALQLKTYGDLSEKQLTALKNIELSGRHLLALINDILDLSKIEAGKLELQLETFTLVDICQSSLQLTKGLAHQKNQKVSFSMNASEVLIHADPRRLKQMLVNLLSNAIKFTPSGGSLGLIVESSATDQVIRLTVWDNGIGIAAADLPRLFQPFVQLDSRLARQNEGTGLGLSLVQRMTEMHGGSLQVESTPGEGSRFTIALPWLPQNTQPPVRQPHQTERPEQSLTVEDNPLDAEHLTRYLRTLGLENVVLPVGSGAVDLAIRSQPDLILLDLYLPDKSGLEVLAELKAEARTQAIPVIITSIDEKRSEAQALGAAGYLVKPFSLEELQTELIRAIPAAQSPASVMVVAPLQKPPLVLIVDDNEMLLQIIADLLETKSLRVATARSGLEMLQVASEIHPDLILLDIQMPGMDGLEATRRLRAHADSALAATPIIALTALAMTGDRERCLEAGVNDYLSKPVPLHLLETRIFTLLASRPAPSA